MIKRAEVTLELELGKEIDYNDCTDAEKEFITVLAAIYAICYLTGGSAVGLCREGLGMTAVPQAYYQFVMDYAPYVYIIPPNTPDAEWGRAAFAAAFAIDFLYEAYFDQQFEDRRTEIRSKIVSLANWILTQQCTNDAKLAYGGFRSNENSTYYYSVDGCRVIPSLLKAYELTSNADYLNAAVLAGATFLYNMQHKPRELGVHDKYYGGFTRAVTETDAWLQQMDVESGFDWTQIKKVRFDCWFTGAGTGSFWIDSLYFGGRRYSSTQEDTTSQTNYGLRELVEVDEELYSDNECMLRAKALLNHLKEPAEYLTLRSTVIDYGDTPILPGDKIHVTLPNENVDADFRILNVEYYVDAKTQTLEITLQLGHEQPFLADYLFALRSKTDHLSRYKVARLI